MYSAFNVSYGEGSLSLESTIIKTQDGISIYIGGGEKAHIGTTVISQPRASLTGNGSISCTTSVINILGHKDDEIIIPIAEKVCKHFNETTVVVAGVHIDRARAVEIEKLKRNGDRIASLIIESIEAL